MDGNIPNTPPTISVPRPEDRPRFDALTKEMAAAKAKVDARKEEARGDFPQFIASGLASVSSDLAPTGGRCESKCPMPSVVTTMPSTDSG